MNTINNLKKGLRLEIINSRIAISNIYQDLKLLIIK